MKIALLVVLIALGLALAPSAQITVGPPIPTCFDSAGQHLNYTNGSFSCGTSLPTGMVTQTGGVTPGNAVTWSGSNVIQDSGKTIPSAPLSGTSSTQNPGALLAGACNTFTISVTGATTGQTASVSAIGGVTLGATVSLTANVTSANTVTVNECALVGVTPASAQFRVVVQ